MDERQYQEKLALAKHGVLNWTEMRELEKEISFRFRQRTLTLKIMEIENRIKNA